MPSTSALPPNTSANSGDSTSSVLRSSNSATSGDHASNRGAATGVGITRDQHAPSTCLTARESSGSPGSSRTKVLSNRNLFMEFLFLFLANARLAPHASAILRKSLTTESRKNNGLSRWQTHSNHRVVEQPFNRLRHRESNAPGGC